MKSFHEHDFKIGFIGGGHICEAMTRGIILSGYVDPGMIYISTRKQERRVELHERLGVRTNKSNIEVASLVDILFITVRPLEVEPLCEEIKDSINEGTLVVSVAAGITIERINKILNHPNIARIMPNLPARVRSSTTAAFRNPDCDEIMFHNLGEFIGGFGEFIEIDREELINPITVLSGSAPAYFVMIADALIQYGIEEGIPKETCKRLILDTIEGSAQWALSSPDEPKDLWPRVVTKGGITAAGMEIYNKKELIKIFVEGLRAATKKARSI